MIPNNPEIINEIKKNIKAITFDLWGTLINDVPVRDRAIKFKQMRKDFFVETLAEFGHEIDQPTVDAAYQHASEVFDINWKQQRAFDATLGIDAMLDFVKVDVPEETKEKLVLFFEEVINETLIRIVEGGKEVVLELHKKYKIGLISDTSWTPGRVLEQHLHRHGIGQCFDSLIFSDQHGQTKPAPALFEKAMSELGVTPEETLHVGDLKFTDIRGANQVGCYSAWVHRPDYLENGTSEDMPHLTIDSVADLREVLL
ncbi:MAG: HAD family hydrolase [Calditrichaeota bacterium]|nr:MAG: HAD family hydrolase [Calditrichota bacterium]